MTPSTEGCDLLIRNVLVMDAGRGWSTERVDVEIDAGRIASVRPTGATPVAARRIIDGRERLLVPGFINTHTHSPANVLKGIGDGADHREFMWINQADTAGRSADEIRLSALVGAIEHLRNGTTAVIDHFPEQGFKAADVDALASAYSQAGLRACMALRIFDATYDDILPAAGFPQDAGVPNPLDPPDAQEQLALVEAIASRHDRTGNGLIRVFPAPSNPLRCSDRLLVAASDLASRLDLGVHTHLLETRIQSTLAYQRYGHSMVTHLDRLGVLDERLSCAHVIWVDQSDIELLAARGTTVVHNPESNLKIGAGFAPIASMLAAGVNVAVGTDGANTNDNLGMHEALRLAAILPRPGESDRRRWPTVAQALSMGTVAGARALLEPRLGQFMPGAPADCVLYDLHSPSWTPLNDAAAQLLFSENGSSVSTVIVNGRLVIDDRQFVSLDVDTILREARGIVRSIRERNSRLAQAVHRITRDLLQHH